MVCKFIYCNYGMSERQTFLTINSDVLQSTLKLLLLKYLSKKESFSKTLLACYSRAKVGQIYGEKKYQKYS